MKGLGAKITERVWALNLERFLRGHQNQNRRESPLFPTIFTPLRLIANSGLRRFASICKTQPTDQARVRPQCGRNLPAPNPPNRPNPQSPLCQFLRLSLSLSLSLSTFLAAPGGRAAPRGTLCLSLSLSLFFNGLSGLNPSRWVQASPEALNLKPLTDCSAGAEGGEELAGPKKWHGVRRRT